MGLIQRFLLGNRVEDDLQVGLFLKNDGTVWSRNPDGSETQLGGGASLPSWWSVDTPDEFVLAEGSFAVGAIADYAASLGAILSLSVTEAVADGSSTTINIPGFGSTDIGPVGGLIVTQGSPGKQPGALQLAGTVLYLQMPDADTFEALSSLPPVTVFGYKHNGVGGNPFVDVIQVWKDYATGLAWGIGYGGQEWMQAASPPDDTQIATSQRWQWYEDTVGAAKQRIWEKDSAGTLIKRISAVYTDDASAFAGLAELDLPATPTAAQIATALAARGLVTLT